MLGEKKVSLYYIYPLTAARTPILTLLATVLALEGDALVLGVHVGLEAGVAPVAGPAAVLPRAAAKFQTYVARWKAQAGLGLRRFGLPLPRVTRGGVAPAVYALRPAGACVP